ncbi:uncharacterized protein PG998_014275 [Apiospora kogelbergensis]|uniref:uncharacterized protein n=1 Tax=Apiospora kogelbergensis TaxID=1337665 RepID=UPI00312DE7D9
MFPCLARKSTSRGQVSNNHPDFSPNPAQLRKPEELNLQPPSNNFQINLPDETKPEVLSNTHLPPYTVLPQPPSAHKIAASIRAGLDLRIDHGPVNAFNSLRQRCFRVWIDDNHRLQPVTKSGIRQIVFILLLLAQTTDCEMEFLFMSQSNTQSQNLSEASRSKAEARDELWYTTSWDDAKALVERSPALKTLGIDQWIKTNSAIQRQHQGNHQTSSTGPNGAQMSDIREIKEETNNEKHVRLLFHVRGLKAPDWQGYHQRDLDMKKIRNLHIAATKRAKQQPKCLNNISFTYYKEIGEYKRKMVRKESATPTTVLILTASPLQAAESDAIMKFQKENDVSMFKRRGSETVEGQGTQFCISTLAFGQFIDKSNMKYYVNIDDHFPGEDDINDLIPVNDTMIAKFGLSAKSWMKLLNAHNPTIDNMKFKKEEEKYGTEPLVTNDQDPLTMPSLVDIKRAFGLVDESEEEAD